jgi:hypothetical protein
MKFRRELTLVYQMGKVGSSAIEKAVPGALHLHTVRGGRYWLLRRFDKKRVLERVVTFLRLLKLRMEIKFAKRVSVVTLVRSPHKRNVSYFFQRLYVDINYYYQDNNVDPRVANFEVLFDAFEYNVRRLDHYLFDRWFEEEFKRCTGIDIYSKAYDHDSGFVEFKKKNIKVFLTRSEDLSRCQKELEEFLGKSVSLERVNDGSQKWYSDIYRRFKDEYTPSEDYLDSIKEMRTYRHFYQGEEV